MPDLNATRAALENAFITGWGATTPIAYDNVNYTQTLGQSFVRLSVDFLSSNNACVGSRVAGLERQRHEGLVTLVIYVPLDEGTGAAYDLADTYKGIMDNQDITTNLHTGTSDVRRSGEQVDGFWSIICLTTFTSDE